MAPLKDQHECGAFPTFILTMLILTLLMYLMDQRMKEIERKVDAKTSETKDVK